MNGNNGFVGMSLIIIGVTVAALAAGLFVRNNFFGTNDQVEKNIVVSNPWIEVIKPGAYISKSIDDKEKELRTGDELNNGDIIKTDKEGKAFIYFPDGSVARLDSNTSLILEEGLFNKANEKLSVKLFLTTGRVWSKIIELATPGSLWEVKTSNTVATVRGTAFGIEYDKGQVSIIGSENKIELAIVDIATKKILENRVVTVSAGKSLTIKEEDVAKIKKDAKILSDAIIDTPVEVLKEKWVQESQEKDKEVNNKLEELKAQGLEPQEVKEKFREELINSFAEEIKERREEKVKEETTPQDDSRKEDMENPEEINTKKEVQIETETSEVKPESSSASARIKEETKIIDTETEKLSPQVSPTLTPLINQPIESKVEKLLIESDKVFKFLAEGERIKFSAFAVSNDGTRKNVTDQVRWQVLGDIGKITQDGIFEPVLGDSVAEFGEGFGSITAVFADPVSGLEILANTPIFQVNAKVEEIPDLDQRG